eukprot:g41632.t1
MPRALDRPLRPQSVWDRAALERAFQDHGIKPTHSRNLYKFLVQRELKGHHLAARYAPAAASSTAKQQGKHKEKEEDKEEKEEKEERGQWWAGVAGLPKAAEAVLAEHFALTTSTVSRVVDGEGHDGKTSKLVVQLQDGLLVESVVIRHQKVTHNERELLKPRLACASSPYGTRSWGVF